MRFKVVPMYHRYLRYQDTKTRVPKTPKFQKWPSPHLKPILNNCEVNFVQAQHSNTFPMFRQKVPHTFGTWSTHPALILILILIPIYPHRLDSNTWLLNCLSRNGDRRAENELKVTISIWPVGGAILIQNFYFLAKCL